MDIKVSVIIPAYNTEQYIHKAISSVLSQTLTNIEVIVVDDCSTDNTVGVVQIFADPRVKLLFNQQNLGVGSTRNRALGSATGEWVAVLDSDDWYAPKRLERLVQIAEEKNADFIADNLYLIEDGDSSPWGTLIGQSGENIDSITRITAAAFVGSQIEGKGKLRLGFTKPLLKRDFLVRHNIKYDETLKIGEDFWLDMQCFLHGATFFLVPEPYYFYRGRSASLVSSNKIERLENQCQKINDFLENKDYLSNNPQVARALLLHKRESQKWLNYYRIVEPLKQGELSTALTAMVTNPEFFQHLSTQIPKIIKRRLKSYFGNTEDSNQKTMFQTKV